MRLSHGLAVRPTYICMRFRRALAQAARKFGPLVAARGKGRPAVGRSPSSLWNPPSVEGGRVAPARIFSERGLPPQARQQTPRVSRGGVNPRELGGRHLVASPPRPDHRTSPQPPVLPESSREEGGRSTNATCCTWRSTCLQCARVRVLACLFIFAKGASQDARINTSGGQTKLLRGEA